MDEGQAKQQAEANLPLVGGLVEAENLKPSDAKTLTPTPKEPNEDAGHEADAKLQENNRKKELFRYILWAITILYASAAIVSATIIYAVGCGATSWFIALASAWVLTPTILLGCLLSHVLGDGKSFEKTVADLINKTPMGMCARTGVNVITKN